MYFTRLSTFFRNDSDTSINITVPNDTRISTNSFEINTNRNVITSMKQRENEERFDAVNYQSLSSTELSVVDHRGRNTRIMNC